MQTGHDVLIVGAGLAGLVAACEAADRGARVMLLDQEGPQNIGGQAHWSLGGLFLVDSPEQRRMGIRDSADLAWSDWQGTVRFAPDDHWQRKAAQDFVAFAAGPMRAWLHGLGLRWFPVVGWAERGGTLADGHGNSVPRFHLTWGTGPGVLKPFIARARDHEAAGRLSFAFRHRVTEILREGGCIAGLAGQVLADDPVPQGAPSSRTAMGDFEYRAGAVVIASGGIGADFDRVRRNWPVDRLGPPPTRMISGVPAHVDGAMLDVAIAAGAALTGTDRMWHYCEGVQNWAPIWPHHGIRILPGPSSLWFDALGQRMEPPAIPGFDTMVTLKRILSTGQDYSWFITTRKIAGKEFALSGSEQNSDLTHGGWLQVIRTRLGGRPTPEVQAFMDQGADFVVADDLETLVAGMNRIADVALDPAAIRAQVQARDAQILNPFAKDAQVTAIRGARAYRGDRLIRVARPHRILDREAGPLVAVKLHVLTRKTLGGIATDDSARVLDADGLAIDGLFAAGEAAGFGGGGYHGHSALEGTFLGGCLFSGRAAGRAAAGRMSDPSA
jgi:predicted oxidoreductase